MDDKARILIVDDTPLNIRVLAETLKGDYSVMAANNGAKALSLCTREQKPDLILLDVMMPEMDGHEVLQRLQMDPATAHIPVVFVTALSEEHDEEKGLSLGAVDYITKPFNPALVKARVRNHLELKRHRDNLEAEIEIRTEQLLEVRHDQARLEGELDTARRLQLSMLRELTFEFDERAQLVAFLNPARSVGGDLFDYTVTADGKALLCLGDVSDKGTSAALFMVKTLTLFRAFMESETRPDKLLAKVNNSLCQFNEEFMFVTMTCCLLDLATGEFWWASGGHEPLLKFGGGACHFLPQETGPALGLMEDSEFPLHADRLQPGQGVVLYSDGITEAQGEDGVEFGEERFRQAIEELSSPDPLEVCDQLLDRVGIFVQGAEQFDDMAVMAIGWQGANSVNRMFTMQNKPNLVEPTLNEMETHLKAVGVDDETIHDLRLVSEELLLNTASYGYDEGVVDEMSVNLTQEGDTLVLEFRDEANPFNPLEAEERDPDDDRLGGWGIPLLKELMDDVQYRRAGEQNILVVRKTGKK